MVKQGDIILIDFNPAIGHEEKKYRPALVISNDAYNNISNLIWVCPISHANNYPLHIALPQNLNTDGKVLCEHLRSMDIESRGYKVIEHVPENFLQDILDYIILIITKESK